MSAASTELYLTFDGKPPFKRRCIAVHAAASRKYISAQLFLRHGKHASQCIAWCHDEIQSSRLEIGPSSNCLWIGHAAFDVSAEEATQIREMFEPIGLRINTLHDESAKAGAT